MFPWSSVGKIYNSARSSCTGSVIAPDKVLTAAHCLFNRATARFLQPDALHFLLGYKRGEFRSHARVASYVLGPNYNPDEVNKSILADWAILVLTEHVATGGPVESVAAFAIPVSSFAQQASSPSSNERGRN